MNYILKNIRDLIKEKDIHITILSKRINMSRQNLYNVFSEKQQLTVELLCKIAVALDVQPTYFFSTEKSDIEKYNTENNKSFSLNEGLLDNIKTKDKLISLLEEMLQAKNDIIIQKEQIIEKQELVIKGKGQTGKNKTINKANSTQTKMGVRGHIK